jgi:tetratricopeptide (TPR) repeat protein
MTGLRHRSLTLCLLALALAVPLAQAQVPPSPTDPILACYLAASEGGVDPYPCDLAVQVARDSGSPGALAGALTNRAMVLTRLQRLEPALRDLNDAVAVAPNNADVQGNRGNLLLRMGRAADALAAHHRAALLAPEDPAVYYNRAFSYQALGETSRAAADVETARMLLAGGPVKAPDIRAPGVPPGP